MKSKREYIIPFIGLKLGHHEFQFEIGDSFFEEREYSIIHSGKVLVNLDLEKKETMLIGEFQISGYVSTECDRCTDQVEIPISGQYRLIYKFGEEISDDEMLIVLHPDAYEIDLRDNIYELITVSLPSRLMHKEGECNSEMIELLKKYSLQQEELEYEELDDDDDDEPIDPRWSGLENLN